MHCRLQVVDAALLIWEDSRELANEAQQLASFAPPTERLLAQQIAQAADKVAKQALRLAVKESGLQVLHDAGLQSPPVASLGALATFAQQP